MLGSRFMIVALFAVVVLLPEKVSAQSFDPHDLSGIWMRTVRDHSFGTKPPPLTQAGIEAMKGLIGDTDDVLREVVEAARASLQVRLNDNGEETNAPWLECNPMGFPRLLNDDEPIEFIITKDKILQVFQLEHRIRYLWTDGRQLPSNQNLENLGPAWYGHSVAKWDGDTLGINTVGLDDRAWLDNVGHPKSFHARIEERYTRNDYHTSALQITLCD